MAAPAGVWLAFGFSPEEAAGEPGPGPGPWRLEAGPEGISRLWPAWSYVVVETGERPGGVPCPLPPPAARDGRSRSLLGSPCLPLSPGGTPQPSHRAIPPGCSPGPR